MGGSGGWGQRQVNLGRRSARIPTPQQKGGTPSTKMHEEGPSRKDQWSWERKTGASPILGTNHSIPDHAVDSLVSNNRWSAEGKRAPPRGGKKKNRQGKLLPGGRKSCDQNGKRGHAWKQSYLFGVEVQDHRKTCPWCQQVRR